jgi:hypothetical protein
MNNPSNGSMLSPYFPELFLMDRHSAWLEQSENGRANE